jgi:hypothetical protein
VTGTAGLPAPVATRADPRLLATGTTQRFVLLLILIAISGIQLASGVLSAPDFPGYAGPHDDGLACLLAAGLNPVGLSMLAPFRNSAAYSACVAHYSWNPAWWWPLAVVGAAGLVAAALYLRLATGRRRVVRAADVDLDGSLTALFGELAQTAGLHRTPRLVVDPTAATMGAVAYGLPRRHTVCLHGGLVTRMRSDPEGFRAVVLHELAHIRNKDVGITYATVATWRVYLVVLLLPASLSAAWSLLSPFTAAYSTLESDNQSLELHALAAAAFMVLLVLLSRADLLRTRETYADLDAARWGAVPREWPSDKPRQGLLAGFLRLWQSHPDWQQRAAALTDTSGLFRVSSVQMFLTGGAAGLILYRLQDDLRLVTGSSGDSLNGPPDWVAYASAAIAAALVAAIAGVQLWRAAAHASSLGLTASSGFRSGLWLAVGLAAGDLLTGSIAVGLQWLPLQPAWLIVLMFLAIVGAMWTADLAALAVGAFGATRARAAMAAGLGVTWLAYTLWLIWWVMLGDLFATGLSVAAAARAFALVPDGTPELGRGGTLTAYSGAIVLVSTDVLWLLVILTLLLWAIPLALLVRRRAGQMTEHEDRPRLRVVLLTGLGGGVACWACALGVMAYMHSWPVPFSERGQAFTLMFFGYLTLCVAAGMAVSAVVTAAVTRAYALTAAMIAAGVASLVGFGGVYALAGSDGCFSSALTVEASACAWRPNAAWTLLSQLPALDWTLGSALAVALAVIVLAAAALVRAVASPPGRVSRPGPNRPAAPPPRLSVRRRRLVASVAAVLIVTVGATTLLVASFAANSGGGLFLSSFQNGTAASQQGIDAALPKPGRPSAAVLRMQAIAWLTVGGLQRSKELYSSLGDVKTALATAADTLGGHTVSRHGLDSALAPVGAACDHLSAVGRSLQTFFPLPDAALNSPWQKELTEIGVGTAACEEGVIKSRSATPANINNILGHYFGILDDNIAKAERLTPALTDMVALAKGR